MSNNKIYKVHFHEPVNGKLDHYFSSLAAIYNVFSQEQIGCGVGRLWNLKVSTGVKYRGKNCIISREGVESKKQSQK